jgi:hypothetical protein
VSPAPPGLSGRRREASIDNEPTVDLDDELALVRATMGEPTVSAWHAAADEAEVPDYAPAELEEVDGIYDLVPPKTEMDVLYDMISGIDEDSVRIYTGLSRPVTQEPRDEPEQLSLIDLVDDEPTHIASRAELAEAPLLPNPPLLPLLPKPSRLRRRNRTTSPRGLPRGLEGANPRRTPTSPRPGSPTARSPTPRSRRSHPSSAGGPSGPRCRAGTRSCSAAPRPSDAGS